MALESGSTTPVWPEGEFGHTEGQTLSHFYFFLPCGVADLPPMAMKVALWQKRLAVVSCKRSLSLSIYIYILKVRFFFVIIK
jgi:hypothetical protein